MIKGSCDFYAIDGYTGYVASGLPNGSAACAANASDPNFPTCAGSSSLAPDGFPIGPSADNSVSWLYSTPYAIRKFLSVITKILFPSIPDIVVSEFGFAEPFEGLQSTLSTILWDLRRADYYQGFLDSILAARVVDGVNVTGAFGWAAYDNFEVDSSHFGLPFSYMRASGARGRDVKQHCKSVNFKCLTEHEISRLSLLSPHSFLLLFTTLTRTN